MTSNFVHNMKRIVAGVLALILVAGALPANPGADSLFGGTTITASAESAYGSGRVNTDEVAIGDIISKNCQLYKSNGAGLEIYDSDGTNLLASYQWKGFINNVQPGYDTIVIQEKSEHPGTVKLKKLDPQIEVTSVSLDQPTLDLTADGDTATLVATVEVNYDLFKSVKWSSSDTSVATVRNGVVTPASAGTAIIKATSILDDTKYAECTVTVNAADPLDHIVSYMAWDDTEKKFVEMTGENACTDYTVVTDSTTTFEDGKWYVVRHNVEIDNRITVTGNVSLILRDGTTLYANQGINLSEGNTLNIYEGWTRTRAESHTAGALTAAANAYEKAGIGGSLMETGGTVFINGGTVTAIGGGAAAGIGGSGRHSGMEAGGSGGTVTIRGGTVIATGGVDSAGIGGGRLGSGGTVTITGGTVTATGGSSAMGIGSGSLAQNNGTLTLGNGVGILVSNDNSTWSSYDGSTRTRYMKTGTLHTHSFTYNSDGATITASCSADGCGLTADPTLTIAPPTMTVSGGTGSAAATLEGLADFNTATGKNVTEADIKYVGRDGTELAETSDAPTAPGKYTAKITVGDATASVDYSIKVTLTFETNGGTPVPEQQVLEVNETATEPETEPTKEGYYFGDWYKDPDFEQKFFFFDSITENTTIYAKWGKNKVTWAYVTPEGTYTYSDVFTGEAPAADSNKFANDAKTMIEFLLDGGTLTDWETSTEENGNVTYTTTASYTLTLNTNGGTVNEGDVTTYVYGKGATLPTDVTKENSQFIGWYDNADLTGNPVTQITAADKGNKEYWAKWKEPNSQTVTFKVVNGSWDDGTTADKTVTLTGYEGDTLKLSADQIPAVGTKPNNGYKEGSWSVTPSTDTAITEAATYTYTFTKAAVDKVKLTDVYSDSYGTLTVEWQNDGYADGYEILLWNSRSMGYRTTVSRFTALGTESDITIDGLIPGGRYFVKVRGYKNIDGKRVYGKFSSTGSATVKKYYYGFGSGIGSGFGTGYGYGFGYGYTPYYNNPWNFGYSMNPFTRSSYWGYGYGYGYGRPYLAANSYRPVMSPYYFFRF